MSPTPSAVVVGGGIVGLATAHALVERGLRVTVVDKEERLAAHQTGHNSGVIHSGLYYRPGSLKARMCVAGARSMREFAAAHDVPHEITGKLVVATDADQLPALAELERRGRANGVPCREVSVAEAREREPHARVRGALWVETTGIIDYGAVCAALAGLVEAGRGEVRLGTEVLGVTRRGDGVAVETSHGPLEADLLVNAAGLHSDRVARMAGLRPAVRIVPFRGEYFELRAQYRDLVRGLLYPVPDARLPFLGVHLTRMVDGSVHAGPNAVLALAREGYRWRDVDLRDLAESLRWPGLWRLGRRYWRTGLDEVRRSWSRQRSLASLRELVPDLPDDALVPVHAGVRAQALGRDGALVDDFHVERLPGQVHVLNAPSPAATAALEIGRHLADLAGERRGG